VSGPTWDDVAAGLPVHDDEVMSSHDGRPSIEVQNTSHGAGTPAPDHGASEQEKYGC
jgi:hypothetical protein